MIELKRYLEYDLDGFSEACYNDNTIDELKRIIRSDRVDQADMDNWNIDCDEWRESILTALIHLLRTKYVV